MKFYKNVEIGIYVIVDDEGNQYPHALPRGLILP